MVDINAALYKVTRNDAKLGSLSENEFVDTADDVRAARPDVTRIDALH